MKLSGLVLAVFALVVLFDVSGSATTHKTTTRTPRQSTRRVITTPKPITNHKPITVAQKPNVNPVTTSKPVASNVILTTPQTSASNNCAQYQLCADIVDKIWATDGETCSFLINKCLLFNVNCYRMNQNMKVLQETTQQLCAPLCSSCVSDINIVCGKLLNSQNTKAFLSECDMKNYVCKTGEPYYATDLSECYLESS